MNTLYFLVLFLSYSYSFSLPQIPIKRSPLHKKIDTKIINLTTPATLNYLMGPIVGIVDGYWISKLGGPIQLSGQGCSDNIFSLICSITSFMPLVLTPIISEHHSKNENDKIIEYMNCSLFFSIIFGINISILFYLFSSQIINLFLSFDSPIFSYANDYLKYRSISFPFVLFNSVIFSVFRGIMDFKSAFYINLKAQLFNLIFDPILIKTYGIKGAAIASTVADILCSINYLFLLKKKNLLKLKFINLKKNLNLLLKNGIFVQMKTISYNTIYFLMNKKILLLDNLGKSSAAHILSGKMIELYSILFDSLRSVGTILIPYNINDRVYNKNVSNRLLKFGVCICIIQNLILLFSKFYLKIFTRDEIVLKEFNKILPYIIAYSSFSGISTIIDGIFQGNKQYKIQSCNSIFSLIGIIIFLPLCKNLVDIWKCIFLLSVIRLPINLYFLRRINTT